MKCILVGAVACQQPCRCADAGVVQGIRQLKQAGTGGHNVVNQQDMPCLNWGGDMETAAYIEQALFAVQRALRGFVPTQDAVVGQQGQPVGGGKRLCQFAALIEAA